MLPIEQLVDGFARPAARMRSNLTVALVRLEMIIIIIIRLVVQFLTRRHCRWRADQLVGIAVGVVAQREQILSIKIDWKRTARSIYFITITFNWSRVK